jgi:tetraacyldisaccharide 4'-kinase
VVARPYKAKAEEYKEPLQVDSRNHTAQEVGDEPLLIAKRLPDVAVWVGKKAEAAKRADQSGAKVVIVDDGFQHFALQRDLDLVVIDALNPATGLCREPLSSLKRADLIFLNCRTSFCDTWAIRMRLMEYTKAPIVEVSYRVVGFYDLQNKPHEIAKGAKVSLFCAIANPDQFKASIESEGLHVVHCMHAADHTSFTKEQLEAFAEASFKKGAEAFICTEKDYVKIEASSYPIFWLKISLQIEKAEDMATLRNLIYQVLQLPGSLSSARQGLFSAYSK